MATNRKSSKAWTVRDAKAHFSEVFERALTRPQHVVRRPRRGAPSHEVVVISAEAYRKLAKPDVPLAEFMSGLGFDSLDLDRPRVRPRDIEFGR
ncbi:MAG: hypothetical protein ACKO1J_06350 [Tagaea sp.]